MIAQIHPTAALHDSERRVIADRMTWAGSDFQKAIVANEANKGTICICKDARGSILGWARTEKWENWPTLEAFVSPEHRRTGVGTFCAAGLAAFGAFEESDGYCAVFDRGMLKVASRVGLRPILFTKILGSWKVDWVRQC